MDFGKKLRSLRNKRGLTLRALAEATGVSFTYLSKIENGRVPYTPAADTIRSLAKALDVEPLELLRIAGKVPPELAELTSDTRARRFFDRAKEIASPADWVALLDFLEERKAGEKEEGKGK